MNADHVVMQSSPQQDIFQDGRTTSQSRFVRKKYNLYLRNNVVVPISYNHIM